MKQPNEISVKDLKARRLRVPQGARSHRRAKPPQPRKSLRACLKNSGAGLRPAMNGRLARENTGPRRPKGRRDACPTTAFRHVLRARPEPGQTGLVNDPPDRGTKRACLLYYYVRCLVGPADRLFVASFHRR